MSNFKKQPAEEKQVTKSIRWEDFPRNFCPEWIGPPEVKELLALQLFSDPKAGGHGNARERLNVLLCGGAGSGKTMLAIETKRIFPKSQYCTPRDTGIGIQEAVRDACGYTVVIDDFDKMDPAQANLLLEALELGRITIHKHGVSEEYDARTNIIAIANPIGYVYNENIGALSQMNNISIPLKQRFHLVMGLPELEPEKYREIALNYGILRDDEERLASLREYVKLARKKVPEVNLPDEVRNGAANFFIKLKEDSRYKTFVSPRLLTGFLNCIKARARMQLKSEPDRNDFTYICQIFDRLYLKDPLEP